VGARARRSDAVRCVVRIAPPMMTRQRRRR
jgi:hypothetical protein